MTDALLPVGLRHGVVFELNANGRPNATGTTAYEGIEFAGPKAYTLTLPPPRLVPHAGNDRVIAIDQLPTLEASAGEIRVSAVDYDLDALLTGVKKFAVGQSTMIGRQTDQQGSEPQVGLLLYQQALDKATKLRRWHFHLIPSTRCVPILAGFGENPEEHRYSLAPNPVTKHLWGVTLGTATEGVLEAGIFDGFTVNKPKIVAFQGNGSVTAFNLPTNYPASSTTTMTVWVDGVLDATVTKTVTGITFSVAPASGADIVVFYEHA